MKNLVGPVEVLDGGHQWNPGLDAELPFVTLAGSVHEALFDEIEDGMAFHGRAFGIET